jgi:hypothetical protein
MAIYGELFGPDYNTYLDQDTGTRWLGVDTRLEYIKYCIPDYATNMCQDKARGVKLADGTIEPRRAVKDTGPYAPGAVDKGNS